MARKAVEEGATVVVSDVHERRLDEAADAFPADQPRVSRAERAEAIRIRERHVQKRFRVF